MQNRIYIFIFGYRIRMAQHIFDELFDQLKIKVKEFLDHDGGGHDYQHAQRVFNLALHICQNE